jgi:hypothetical protein
VPLAGVDPHVVKPAVFVFNGHFIHRPYSAPARFLWRVVGAVRAAMTGAIRGQAVRFRLIGNGGDFVHVAIVPQETCHTAIILDL